MANLVNANAANAAQVVNGYAYNRSLVKAGILHFGVGNFHRAHLEYMTNKLLENNTQQNWGICGAMILPGDERLYNALKKQDGEYTLTVCGRDDSIHVYQLGALVELYWGVKEQEQILNKIASKILRLLPLLSRRVDIIFLARQVNSCSIMHRWLMILKIQPIL